jgi:mono/diheme cytochrome c family protein
MRRACLAAAMLLVPVALLAQAPTPTPPPVAIPAGADGAKIFAITCAACHLATGLGTEGKVPPLAGSEWVLGDEGRLVRIILHGLVGEVEVQGEMFSGAMPTWGGAFTDEQIAAVATYVRRSWGNKAPPIAAETVAKVRQQSAARKTPWTIKELLQRGN